MARHTSEPATVKSVVEPLTITGPSIRGDAGVLNSLFPSIPAPSQPGTQQATSLSVPKPRTRFKQADITRAVKALTKAGQSISETAITADGTIRLSHGNAAESETSEYDRWKSRRDARPS